MRNLRCVTLTALCLTFCAASPLAQAQQSSDAATSLVANREARARALPPQEGPQTGTVASEDATRLTRLILADRTLAYARVSGNPEAWLLAAQLYQDVGLLREDRPQAAPVPAAPEGFWDEARAAFGDDRTALALLERAQARQRKWLVDSGPVDMRVLPGDAGSRTLRYEGGEPAAVQLRTIDGSARITVFDQNGLIICRTDWDAPSRPCRWTPRWTGPFIVRAERRSGRGAVRIAAY